jgi:antitoxin (DNA-binding transcriptional repressor) of toxin-antitoxin stability system
MRMATIHISEAKAARDFADLIAHVRAGTAIVIESDARSVAVVHPAGEELRSRLHSESIALAEANAKELTYEPRMDLESAADMEEIIRIRKPRDTSAWD